MQVHIQITSAAFEVMKEGEASLAQSGVSLYVE